MRPAPRTQTRLPTVTCEEDKEVSKDRSSKQVRGLRTTMTRQSLNLVATIPAIMRETGRGEWGC